MLNMTTLMSSISRLIIFDSNGRISTTIYRMKSIRRNGRCASSVVILDIRAFAESFRFPVIFEDHQNIINRRIAVFDTNYRDWLSWRADFTTSKTGKKSFSRMGGNSTLRSIKTAPNPVGAAHRALSNILLWLGRFQDCLLHRA